MADIQLKRGAEGAALPPLKPGEPVMLGGRLYVTDKSGAAVKMATAAEVEGRAAANLSNVTNQDFKTKADSAGIGGGVPSVYDVVIRTQAEFEALIASPTWLGAISVCFIGDGGTLKFTRSDGQGCKIPQTVKQIQGINSATIEVTNYADNGMHGAAFWYGRLPTTEDYWIDGIVVRCAGYVDSCFGFRNCAQLINCIGNGANTDSYGQSGGFSSCAKITSCTGIGTCNNYQGGSGFQNCTELTNCIGTGRGTGNDGVGYGFYSCTRLNNCTGLGDGKGTGFQNCTQLANCTGSGGSPRPGNGYGFKNCVQLSNCAGSGSSNGNGSGYGFYDCAYLNGCKQGASPSSTGFLGGTNTKIDTATVVAS